MSKSKIVLWLKTHVMRKKEWGDPIADLVSGFSKNELVGYFLILWAMTFIFSAVSGFLWIAGGHGSIVDIIVDGLWDMSKIGCL